MVRKRAALQRTKPCIRAPWEERLTMAATPCRRTLRPDIARRTASSLFAGALLYCVSSGHARAASAGPTPIPSDETPLERALREYPPAQTNAAAFDLERLAEPLGIDLVPGIRLGRHGLARPQ